MGHKANHSFKWANARFGYAIHPRFGPIRSIVANRDINKGDEILVNYQYPEHTSVPKWYATVYEKEMERAWPGNYIFDDQVPDMNHK